MTLLIVILAALAPALGLLIFIYKKDSLRQEPVPELLRAFGYGVLSALVSMLFSTPMMRLGVVPSEPLTVWDHIRVAVFGAGIPEELAKFIMLMQFLNKCRYFDACVGLGFAGLENILYLIQNYEAWVFVGAMRALVSVPGHFFFAVMMGYFLAKAVFDGPERRTRNIVLALVLPMLCHSAFDALLMVSTVSAAASGLIALFGGLYFFMARTTKRMYRDAIAKDEQALRRNRFF